MNVKKLHRQMTPDKFEFSFSQGKCVCRQCLGEFKFGIPADFTAVPFLEYAKQHLGHCEEGGAGEGERKRGKG